jgi:hypothetical protein
MRKVIPFGPYTPDLGKLGNQGSPTATNVIPLAVGYGPMPDLTVISAALGARCQGAVSVLDSAGNVTSFAGTATKLYKLDNTDFTWDDVTRASGGDYATPADGGWSFTLFGSVLVAENGVDDTQRFTVGSSSNFSALGGSPPVGKFIAVERTGFLMKAWIAGFPQRVQWSGLDDIETWAASQTTQSDAQDLLGDSGWNQGIVCARQPIIFQERAIWAGQYENVPKIFRFEPVELNRGCKSPGSIAYTGRGIFFYADDGFYVFDTFTLQATPIGKDMIDEEFADRVDNTYLYRITSAIDPIKSLYYVAYPGAGNSGGNPNEMLVYNWKRPKWSLVTGITCEILMRDLSKGFTLEQLDNINSSIDALPFSLDSRAYTGGNILQGAFNSDHKLCYFTGPALAATIDTGEMQLALPERAVVTSAKPVVDNDDSAVSGTPTVAMLARELQTDAVTVGSDVSMNAIGECEQRSSARYHAARFKMPAAATWKRAQGVAVEFVPDGAR